MSEDEFFLRPGRIGDRGSARGGAGPRTFIGVALVAARRAGGLQRLGPVSASTFGRGRGASLRASQLATLELGPRTDADLLRAWDQQVGAEHWTSLDKSLTAQISETDGLVDLRPPVLGRPDARRVAEVARVRRLETLGLAEEVRPGRWRLDPEAQVTLKALGQSRDIIARINRALGPTVQTRDPSSFVIEASPGQGLVGRLAGRGLHDELTGAGYVVVDGLDGRVHHVRGADLDQAAALKPGAIVELQAIDGGRGLRSIRLMVRSDLDLADQVQAQGATWLDRQLVGARPAGLGAGGFADDVRQALSDRIDHLESQGLARRRGAQVIFARDLLATLKEQELASTISRLEQASGLTHQPLTGDDPVTGVYRQRLNLASGRFAMIETGLGFSLVPWRPDMDRYLGREITGVPAPGGGMTWSPGPRRGLTR